MMLSQRVIEGFMKYDWPGNVRELQNVVERMVVTAKGTKLNLPADWLSVSLTQVPYELLNSQRLNSAVASQEETTVESVERAHILKILEQKHWRIEGPHGAAVVLGLKPEYIAFAHAEITYRSIVRRREVSLSHPAQVSFGSHSLPSTGNQHKVPIAVRGLYKPSH